MVVVLFAIYSLQRGRLPKLALLLALGTFVVFFGVVTVQRTLSAGGSIQSFGAAANTTLAQFGNYLASGPVGFSVYLTHPQLVPPVWDPWRFFERTANYLGNYYDVPDLNASFVQIGNGLYYNTYTAFFSYYPPYGLLGVIGFMLGIGFVAGVAYRRACNQSLLWQLLFAWAFFGTLMTIFNENFLLALNPMLKIFVITMLVIWIRRLRIRKPVAGII